VGLSPLLPTKPQSVGIIPSMATWH
jgi:hypothetical protein